jgi:hypothetical protein
MQQPVDCRPYQPGFLLGFPLLICCHVSLHAAALPSTLPAHTALSETVKDKPVGVDILGSRITLFRDETGQVVAVDDTCPHRGAPLSDGWTATDKTTGKK